MNLLFLTLLFGLTASAAHADPATLIISTLGLTGTAAALTQIGVGLVMSKIASSRVKNAANTNAPILTTTPSVGEDTPQTLMLGYYATPGHIVAPLYTHAAFSGGLESLTYQSDSAPNFYRVRIMDLSDHPIDGLEKAFINGEEIELDGATHAVLGKTNLKRP